MKQFNLEEYLANPNRKVVTRDGSPARIICTDKKGSNQPILALVQVRADPMEVALTFGTDGRYDIGRESCYDLFFAPKKYVKWGLSLCGYKIVIPRLFNSKEEAQRFMEIYPDVYGSIVKVEWEE